MVKKSPDCDAGPAIGAGMVNPNQEILRGIHGTGNPLLISAAYVRA
jgi:hypothetical protein